MAGIYLHIPYCKQACHYCDFHFSTQLATKPRLLQSMHEELRARIADLDDAVSSIYFGGGTPSILHHSECKELLNIISTLTDTEAISEITLEANPDDLTDENLSGWKDAGINRLSIGLQSFRDSDLRWMNRAHTAEEALNAVNRAKAHGFQNLTVDLIYGIPQWKSTEWKENLEQLFKLQVDHFSAYILTVEEGTAYGHKVKHGKDSVANDEQVQEEYDLLCTMAREHGYNHYEVSNFAKDGHSAMHNSSYWAGSTYLGVGPGAHSFDGKTRRWNIANNQQYMKAIEAGEPFWESEELQLIDRYNEMIMTGLRTARGINTDELYSSFGRRPEISDEAAWNRFLAQGQIIPNEGAFRLSEPAWLISDQIASELFWV